MDDCEAGWEGMGCTSWLLLRLGVGLKVTPFSSFSLHLLHRPLLSPSLSLWQ